MEFPRREFLVVWASLTDDFGERLYDRHVRPREPHGHLARTALSASTELWAGKQVRQKFSDITAATPTCAEGISPIGVISVSTARAAGIEKLQYSARPLRQPHPCRQRRHRGERKSRGPEPM